MHEVEAKAGGGVKKFECASEKKVRKRRQFHFSSRIFTFDAVMKEKNQGK